MGSMKRKGQCGSKGQISGSRAPEPSASRRHCQSQKSLVEGGDRPSSVVLTSSRLLL